MINILYSNDYEVFLGGNYASETEVLIKTTEDVLSACDDIGVPMTLFCDLACLWRYREFGYNEFPDAAENQLKEAIIREHDVQTHIHPHWFDTDITFSERGFSEYSFDLSKFLLGNWVPKDESTLQDFCVKIFKRAKTHLEDLFVPLNPNYRCMAFRAGGYGIQPNTRQIFDALEDVGYLIDSSIVPGMVSETNVNRIDFSAAPQMGNYFVSPESDFKGDSDMGMFEIPVLALRQNDASWILAKSFVRKLLKYIINQTKPNRMGYPVQSNGSGGKGETRFRQVLDEVEKVRKGWFMLELGADVNLMVDATRQYIKCYGNSETDLYFSFSCHSKTTYPDALDALKRYHGQLEKIYGEQLKAITFQEAGHKLKLSGGLSN
ncbi:hypothetical protein HQ531_05720 [bacterium]|nr:hypothetical protein [bacterium]